jgi:integration host factor subunit alpha
MNEEIPPLTKEKLCDEIHKKLGISGKNAKQSLEVVLEEVKSELATGKTVKITGFGKWSCKEKKARPGRNPHTGGKIEISARKVVVFSASDKLRGAINNPS